MDLLERAIFLAIGGGIGFILGFIVANLRDIKEEVDEVLDIEKRTRGLPTRHIRDERGFMRHPVIADAMLLLVLVLTVWAAFGSQKASNDVQATQDDIQTVTTCNQKFLGELLIAVNERTTFTADQARANIRLQTSQSKFLAILLADPPKTDLVQDQALRLYYTNLTEYVKVNGQAAKKAEENPYPTIEDFNYCLENYKE